MSIREYAWSTNVTVVDISIFDIDLSYTYCTVSEYSYSGTKEVVLTLYGKFCKY